MKKRIITVLLALAVAIAIPTTAFAAEQEALPEPGMSPGHSLYFMETLMQRLNMAFTFGAEARLQKALHYAGEKLAEMESAARQNRTHNMEKAANQYRYYLNIANRNMAQATNSDNGTPQRVATMIARHLAIMTLNQNNCSADCQQVRARTRLHAEECQENAIRTLARHNAQQAIELNLALMEQQREQIQNMIGKAGDEAIIAVLQQYERIRNMNQEMIAAGDQLGLETQTRQRLQQAIANQDSTLNQIRNQYQYGNPGTVTAPVQETSQTQEQQGTGSGSTPAQNSMSGSGPAGPAPNSGDGIPDGSGFVSPNGNTYGRK